MDILGTLRYAVESYKRPSDWPLCNPATAATNRVGCDAEGSNFADLVDSSVLNYFGIVY